MLGSVLLPMLTEIDFSRLEDAHAAELRKLCVERFEEVATAHEGTMRTSRREAQRLGGDLGTMLIACRRFLSLLQADDVGEILVNGPHRVQVERDGRRVETDATFPSTEVLLQFARWMTAAIGRPASEADPVVDGRLPDGARLSVVLPPVALDGPVLSIRRGRHLGYELDGLATTRMFPPALGSLLRAAVIGKLNVLVSGAAGSGRTTLLGALARCGNPAERVATIEELAELRLGRPHVMRLERGADTSPRELLRTAMRMRPDRLVVGDLAGPEAWDLVQAMAGGYGGSLAAIRAASPRDAIERLEGMVQLSEPAIGERVMRRQLGRTIDLVIHLRRLGDGRRVIDSLCEIEPGDPVVIAELFRFHEHGEGPGGRSQGTFAATGHKPRLVSRLARRGLHLPEDLWRLRQAS